MSKKHCLRIESLPYKVVEHILVRLPVKSLLRFKAVSKQRNSRIKSRCFQEKQLTHRQRSGDPDVLMVSVYPYAYDAKGTSIEIESLRTMELGSSATVKIPTPWDKENIEYLVSHSSCDGLVCLCNPHKSGYVVNPTTRWYRPLPLCDLQQLMTDLGDSYYKLGHPLFRLGFGKDKFTATYKPVWLYNSAEIGLENSTTCEIFDFSTNAWRYVTPAAPYRVAGCPDPVYVDGSLYWFTECEETKVYLLIFTPKLFKLSLKLPMPMYIDTILSCATSTTTCAYSRGSGRTK